MDAAIRIEGLVKRYGDVVAVDGLDLEVRRGECFGLLGPNGAGKTTLLDWCAGAATEAYAADGTLRLDGREATTWPASRRASAGLRYVPFERNVFPGLSVLDNLRATAGPAGTESAFSLFPELSRLTSRPAGVLSGGERQLLAVACALSGRGRILLLDEPTHGLAPTLVDRVLDELARTAREDDRAVLIAEPQLNIVARHVDFVWPLERGLRHAASGA